MSVKIPFFHYTSVDNLNDILKQGRICSRDALNEKKKNFKDVSIDPTQSARTNLNLTGYIPMFAGFYELFRNFKFNGYLMNNYDEPKVQNPSFFGSLHKTLQASQGKNYQNIIIFMIKDETIYSNADSGRIRLFSDISIKQEATEFDNITDRNEMQDYLLGSIDGSNTTVEVDLLDDGETSIGCMCDIEAIIVDNEEIENTVNKILKKNKKHCPVFVNTLPR